MKQRLYYTAISIFLTLLLGAGPIFAQPIRSKKAPSADIETLKNLDYDSAFFERKRDPILAGILSWYVPGLGQYYSGNIWKGTAFLITEYTLTLGALFYFLNFNFSAGSGTGFKVNVDAKRTDLGVVETSRKNIFAGIMSLVLVIHIYNVSDAVKSARVFNGELEMRRKNLHKAYPFIYTNIEKERSVYLGMQSAF